MLELKDALHNLRRAIAEFMNLHVGVILLRNDGLLLREIAHTLEDEIRARRGNLNVQLLPESVHVATDLLEILARHMDDAREVEVGNLNVLDIRVEELQEIVRDRGLLRVLHANPEFVGIRRGEIQGEVVIVAHRLDELEKVDHVHPEHMLRGAEVVLKSVCVKTEIYKNSMCLINRHNLNTLGIKLEIGLG